MINPNNFINRAVNLLQRKTLKIVNLKFQEIVDILVKKNVKLNNLKQGYYL